MGGVLGAIGAMALENKNKKQGAANNNSNNKSNNNNKDKDKDTSPACLFQTIQDVIERITSPGNPLSTPPIHPPIHSFYPPHPPSV